MTPDAPRNEASLPATAAPGALPFVSRGGLKLAAALDAFQVDPTDWVCADLGCSTGGFTDCLLQRGARQVYAVDTAYGELAWKLRQDPRVVVCERSNALYTEPQAACDLVVLDLGWTRQEKAIPAALGWLADHPGARILTLIKPHYEQPRSTQPKKRGEKRENVLTDDQARAITDQLIADVLPTLGVAVLGLCPSPVHGGKGGNLEFLALLQRDAASPPLPRI